MNYDEPTGTAYIDGMAVEVVPHSSLPEVIIYVDGACQPNPGHMGVGIVLLANGARKELSEYVGQGTNQQAEINAARLAFQALKKPCRVTVFSDSQYLVQTMNGAYRRGTHLNLWEDLDRAIMNHQVKWVWVKGHNGDKENERANLLAENAARRRK